MHVGAPVRESTRFMVSDIRFPLPPCNPPSRVFPSSSSYSPLSFNVYLLLPFSLSFLFLHLLSLLLLSVSYSLSLSLSSFRSLSNLHSRSSSIGRLVLTRLIQMNRGLFDVSLRGLTGFSKLKRGGREGEVTLRVAEEPTETSERSRFVGLLFFFCAPAPIRPRSPVLFVSVNARFVIVSTRARISSHGPASAACLVLVSRRLYKNCEL